MKLPHWIPVFALFLLLGGLALAQGKELTMEELDKIDFTKGVAARVNGETITWGDVNRRIGAALEALARGRSASEVKAESLKLRMETLRELIEEKLYTLEGVRLGLRITDEDMVEELDRMYREAGGRDEYLRNLESQGLTPEEANKETRARLMSRKVIRELRSGRSGELPPDDFVSPKDVENYYRDHPEEFTVLEGLTFRAVQIHRSRFATNEEAMRYAEAAHRRIDSGATFEGVATGYSHVGGYSGGMMEYVDPDSVPGPVKDTFMKLKDGEISRPFHDGTGTIWFIERVTYQARRVKSFDEVSAKIMDLLFKIRFRQASMQTIQQIWSRTSVTTIFDEFQGGFK